MRFNSSLTDSGSDYRSRVVLHFPPNLVEQPIVCQLIKKFDLEFIILRADIDRNKEGLLVLELAGVKENFRRGVVFLKDNGISVQPLSQDIVRIEERCTHCGACLTICPSEALYRDVSNREVRFEQSKCIACDLCLKGCPVRAMEIHY